MTGEKIQLGRWRFSNRFGRSHPLLPKSDAQPIAGWRSTACYTSDMSRVIAQRDLRNQNARILAAVEAGVSFVVTRNGTPVAELRPLARGRRPFVPRAKIATLAVAGPRIDAAAFRRDLDGAVEQGVLSE